VERFSRTLIPAYGSTPFGGAHRNLRYRHVVGPIRVKSVDGGIAVVHSHFLAARIMHDGGTMLFASGRYLDRVDVAVAPFRFNERIVVLDSDKIDTLLAIPL